MNNQSLLQQQYQLSPKKFVKKLVSQIVGILLVDIILGGIVGAAGSVGLISLGFFPNFEKLTALTVVGIILYFLVIIALHVGLYSWYVKTYIKRYYYDAEEHFITIKKGVFAPVEIHVQWQKIQDVYVDQDILDRIFGLYDVHIASATAASGIEAHIDGVDKAAAEGLKKILLDKVSGVGRNNPLVSTSGSQPLNALNESSQVQNQIRPTINLSEEISNNTYPLSGTWLGISLIGKIVVSLVASAFIVFYFFVRVTDLTFQDNLGYIILGWLALSFVMIAFRVGALLLWKKNYAFKFNPDNIYYREGVISLSETHMPYSSIQDVTVQQNILERMVGLAKVRIENAAQQTIKVGRTQRLVQSGVVLVGLTIADANKITTLLKTDVLGRNTTKYGL